MGKRITVTERGVQRDRGKWKKVGKNKHEMKVKKRERRETKGAVTNSIPAKSCTKDTFIMWYF